MINVSVIIPTVGRHETLERCLEALAANHFSGVFEVIIVNDAREKNLRNLIEKFSACLNIHYIEQFVRQGPAAARNCGAWLAQGEILAFLDDDTVPTSSWLQVGYSLFREDQSLVAVIGRTSLPPGERPSLFKHYMIQEKPGGFPACNFWVRKHAFFEAGGFSEEFFSRKLGIYHHEDADIAFRLIQIGRVSFFSDLLVYHPAYERSIWEPIKISKKAYFDPLLAKRHPKEYAKLTTRRVGPIRIKHARIRIRLTIVASSIAVLVLLLLGHWHVSGIALILLATSLSNIILNKINKESIKEIGLHGLILAYAITLVAAFWFVVYLVRGMIRFRKIVL